MARATRRRRPTATRRRTCGSRSGSGTPGWTCLQRFVHVEMPKKGAGRIRTRAALIFPRFHQWHAVRELTAHAGAHGAGPQLPGRALGRLGQVEHDRLAGAPAVVACTTPQNRPVFDKVIVITDRRVLDRQLQDTIYQFDHVAGVVKQIDEDSEQLAEALTGCRPRRSSSPRCRSSRSSSDKVAQPGRAPVRGDHRRGALVPVGRVSEGAQAGARPTRARDDIDDDGDPLTASALARGPARRTCRIFAFTATPKKKTLELFGTRNPETGQMEPFHVYSMRQAIDEGFILDVLRNYITYKTRWRLANAAVEAAEAADPEVDPAKAKAKLVRAAELHPDVAGPAGADHRRPLPRRGEQPHRRPREGDGGDPLPRARACKLYQAIRSYIDKRNITDCAALVAFSGTLDLDGIDYTEPKLNGFSEAALPAAFGYTKADDPQATARNQTEYRILVVAEKYQTGFDQPLLTTMYVDKLLAGVAAVQTLSRLNRMHTHKSQDDVFVLDFANEAEDIQHAFKPYFETTITEPTDPNLLYDKQREVMDYQLLVDSEMDAFVEALLAAEHTSTTESQLEKAHAQLYRFLQPAVDRFTELATRTGTRRGVPLVALRLRARVRLPRPGRRLRRS